MLHLIRSKMSSNSSMPAVMSHFFNINEIRLRGNCQRDFLLLHFILFQFGRNTMTVWGHLIQTIVQSFHKGLDADADVNFQ